VEVLPNSEATLVIPATLAASPLQGTDYTVRFSTFATDLAEAPRDPLGTATPAVGGRSGVQIAMRFVGNGKKLGLYRRQGKVPPLRGTTTPPLPRRFVWLRGIRGFGPFSDGDWNGQGSFKLGKVRTDARGRFRLPALGTTKVGLFSVLARSQAGAGLPGDAGCGPFFTLPGKADRK
jgi:hypothetical protein